MARMSCWRICNVFLLSCASLSTAGCYFSVYPETYDASDFKEYQFHKESDPPCLERPPSILSWVCESTITRQANGEYVVMMAIRPGERYPAPETVHRTMTDSEVEYLLAIFAQLRINRNPRPNCNFRLPGFPPSGEIFHRWDDLELLLWDCDRPRLDPEQGGEISTFLRSLATEQIDEAAETAEEVFNER